MPSARIRGVDYELQARPEGRCIATVAKHKNGAFVIAEVVSVHTHDCIRRRWGRKNHHKTCNCGADELFAQVLET